MSLTSEQSKKLQDAFDINTDNNLLFQTLLDLFRQGGVSNVDWTTLKAEIATDYNSKFNASNGKIAKLENLILRDAETGDDVADLHNCIYRGKNLTGVYTLAQLSSKLASGDYSDLYIGDYITLPFTYNNSTANINFRIAHFNYWKHMGFKDTTNGLAIDGSAGNTIGETTDNHLVLVPDSALFYDKMNDTNTTAGGVRGCALWAKLQSTVYTALNANTCLAGHILSYSDILSTEVNVDAPSSAGSGWLGSSSNCKWCDEHIGLMTEPMVYGSTVFSSSGRDVGCKKSQLALFRIDPTWITGRSRFHWWLGAVSSSAGFALVGHPGDAASAYASTSRGVRPLILFK